MTTGTNRRTGSRCAHLMKKNAQLGYQSGEAREAEGVPRHVEVARLGGQQEGEGVEGGLPLRAARPGRSEDE